MKTRPNLVLADNNEISLFENKKIAELSGLFASIRLARSGLDAFDLISRAEEGSIPFPDVLLFDLELPVMNGITLLKVLRKSAIRHNARLNLVVLASSISDREREVAESLGVLHFLTKPLYEEELRETMRSIFGDHLCPSETTVVK